MTKPVKLDWFGPVNFLTGLGVPSPEDHDRMTALARPGIYLWVYPKKHYGKTGIYIGKSKNLIKRHFQHLGWWLNGHYYIHKEKEDFFPSQYFDENGNGANNKAFDKHIIKSWEEVRNCHTYFATTDTDEMAFYAERAFIEAFQNLRRAEDNKNEKDRKYFYKQGLRQTKASPDPLEIENTGAEFVKKIFGDKFIWKRKA